MNAQQYIDAIRQVIENPAANLTAVTLIAATVTLLILILLVLILLLLLPGSRRARPGSRRPRVDRPEEVGGEADTPAAEEPAKPRRWPWLTNGLIVALVLAALVSGYWVTSTDSYCADACHRRDAAFRAQPGGTHAGIACVTCHEQPLPIGLDANVTARLGHALDRLTGDSGAYDVTAAYDRCLSCHAPIMNRVVTDASTRVRVSHREPLDAGMTCEDCHVTAGHGSRQKVSMSTCLRCHDGRKASAKCPTCHNGDPGYAGSASSQRIFTTLQLPPVTCGGCHDQRTCDACHGLRMPHDSAFIAGGHARYAGFSKKTLCWRCHAQTDCGACHGDFATAHSGPAFWFPQHKLLPKTATCNTCHRHHTGTMCSLCH